MSCSPDKASTETNGRMITDRESCLRYEMTPWGDLNTMPLLLVHYMTLDWDNMAIKAAQNRAPTDIGAKYTPAWYHAMFTDTVRDMRMLKYA